MASSDGARRERSDVVLAASHKHPLVTFVANSLIVSDAGFAPRPTTTSTLGDKLRALGPGDDLLAAVLGLVDLAFLLRKQGSTAAGDAILAGLGLVQDLVTDALSAWPPDDEALAALRASRFASFAGAAPTVAPERRRAPVQGQVASGPMARMAAMQLPLKKKPPTE
ncbi:MAG: hypothetical protein Q8O67_17705 [Deltaproteobacteria bacterium]|nr:hypothetical protein [Deltaproteobacteria bacterium]